LNERKIENRNGYLDRVEKANDDGCQNVIVGMRENISD